MNIMVIENAWKYFVGYLHGTLGFDEDDIIKYFTMLDAKRDFICPLEIKKCSDYECNEEIKMPKQTIQCFTCKHAKFNGKHFNCMHVNHDLAYFWLFFANYREQEWVDTPNDWKERLNLLKNGGKSVSVKPQENGEY